MLNGDDGVSVYALLIAPFRTGDSSHFIRASMDQVASNSWKYKALINSAEVQRHQVVADFFG